jgi:hypothetical protein
MPRKYSRVPLWVRVPYVRQPCSMPYPPKADSMSFCTKWTAHISYAFPLYRFHHSCKVLMFPWKASRLLQTQNTLWSRVKFSYDLHVCNTIQLPDAAEARQMPVERKNDVVSLTYNAFRVSRKLSSFLSDLRVSMFVQLHMDLFYYRHWRWRKPYNEGLHNLYYSRTIMSIKLTKWDERSTWETRNAYTKASWKNLTGKRPLAWHSRRREDYKTGLI